MPVAFLCPCLSSAATVLLAVKQTRYHFNQFVLFLSHITLITKCLQMWSKKACDWKIRDSNRTFCSISHYLQLNTPTTPVMFQYSPCECTLRMSRAALQLDGLGFDLLHNWIALWMFAAWVLCGSSSSLNLFEKMALWTRKKKTKNKNMNTLCP